MFAGQLLLEDSSPGVNAANEAGMVTVAIPNELTANGDFSAADYRVASLHDVALKLDQLMGVR